MALVPLFWYLPTNGVSQDSFFFFFEVGKKKVFKGKMPCHLRFDFWQIKQKDTPTSITYHLVEYDHSEFWEPFWN